MYIPTVYMTKPYHILVRSIQYTDVVILHILKSSSEVYIPFCPLPLMYLCSFSSLFHFQLFALLVRLVRQTAFHCLSTCAMCNVSNTESNLNYIWSENAPTKEHTVNLIQFNSVESASSQEHFSHETFQRNLLLLKTPKKSCVI